MKKIITLFMLMIGISDITIQAVADLYAIVYPNTAGPISNLYKSNATLQDEVDKFLNNKPSLLDAFNGGTDSSPGLGTRKLYLFDKNNVMQKTNSYIYFDASAGYAKIHYEGATTYEGNTATTMMIPTGKYKKVLIDTETATTQGLLSTPSKYIKIKTSGTDADQGGECFVEDATLNLSSGSGSTSIDCYKMLSTNDYFFSVYQSKTT